MTRLARQMVARAQQGDTNGPTGFDKMPGGDEAIAAVVTRPTQNDNGPRLPAPPDFACDGCAGTLHHIDGWYAGGNRQTIGLGHLANTEQRRLAVHHICATSPIEADRSFRDGPLRLVYECCFHFLRRRGLRFLVVSLGADEVEDHATRHFAVLEPIEDVVDRRQRLQFDIGLDLTLGGEG
jgi:hypothetical protein